MADKQIFGPLELPSGKTITFRAPKGSDRVNIIAALKVSTDNLIGGTLLVDAYTAVKCVENYGGRDYDGDYRRFYDALPQEDADYYIAVFNEMFGMNEEKRDKAKDAARFLLAKPTCIDGAK